jgi:hypothetical protein
MNTVSIFPVRCIGRSAPFGTRTVVTRTLHGPVHGSTTVPRQAVSTRVRVDTGPHGRDTGPCLAAACRVNTVCGRLPLMNCIFKLLECLLPAELLRCLFHDWGSCAVLVCACSTVAADNAYSSHVTVA